MAVHLHSQDLKKKIEEMRYRNPQAYYTDEQKIVNSTIDDILALLEE
jgi:hypothetical protein